MYTNQQNWYTIVHAGYFDIIIVPYITILNGIYWINIWKCLISVGTVSLCYNLIKAIAIHKTLLFCYWQLLIIVRILLWNIWLTRFCSIEITLKLVLINFENSHSNKCADKHNKSYWPHYHHSKKSICLRISKIFPI